VWPLAGMRLGTGLVVIGWGYTTPGPGEWLIIGGGYAAYAGRMVFEGGSP
jgi:hypothetical protein